MKLSERITNHLRISGAVRKGWSKGLPYNTLSAWRDKAAQLEAELSKANFEVGWQMGEKETLRELFIDLLATQGLVTAKREVEIPEELSATLDIGLPLAHRIVDALPTEEKEQSNA